MTPFVAGYLMAEACGHKEAWKMRFNLKHVYAQLMSYACSLLVVNLTGNDLL